MRIVQPFGFKIVAVKDLVPMYWSSFCNSFVSVSDDGTVYKSRSSALRVYRRIVNSVLGMNFDFVKVLDNY